MEILTDESPVGGEWHRIHQTKFGWDWFGPGPGDPPANRFDAPGGEYRTCYFGESFNAAFAESLLRNPGKRLLREIYLEELSVTLVRVTRPVVLAQAHGAGLRPLGMTGAHVHGKQRVCREKSLVVWNDDQEVDGIAYRSRFDNDELCIALFDRAQDAVVHVSTEELLADRHRIAAVCRKYQCVIG